MSLVRIYQKLEGTPASNDLFIFESQTGGVYYDKKVKWTTLMGLIAAINNLQNYYLKTETYTKTEVNQLIAAIPTFSIEVVQELPTEDISTTTIYLVPKQDAGTLDYYDEWINLDGTTSGWEWLGKTEVDLSNYYTKSETEAYVKGDGADYIVGAKTYPALTTYYFTYMIKEGDMIGKIAERFGVSQDTLISVRRGIIRNVSRAGGNGSTRHGGRSGKCSICSPGNRRHGALHSTRGSKCSKCSPGNRKQRSRSHRSTRNRSKHGRL